MRRKERRSSFVRKGLAAVFCGERHEKRFCQPRYYSGAECPPRLKAGHLPSHGAAVAHTRRQQAAVRRESQTPRNTVRLEAAHGIVRRHVVNVNLPRQRVPGHRELFAIGR